MDRAGKVRVGHRDRRKAKPTPGPTQWGTIWRQEADPNESVNSLRKRKCCLDKEVRKVREEEMRKVRSGNAKRVDGVGRQNCAWFSWSQRKVESPENAKSGRDRKAHDFNGKSWDQVALSGSIEMADRLNCAQLCPSGWTGRKSEDQLGNKQHHSTPVYCRVI